MNFTDLNELSQLRVLVTIVDKPIEFNAIFVRIVSYNRIILQIPCGGKVLSFNNVELKLLYCQEDAKPIVWNDVRVIESKGGYYVFQCDEDGIPMQRRDAFRIGISIECNIDLPKHRDAKLILRDLSTTGFSFAIPHDKDLNVILGQNVTAYVSDSGFNMSLHGMVVRRQEFDKCMVYGCRLLAEPKDIHRYIAAKQRRSIKQPS